MLAVFGFSSDLFLIIDHFAENTSKRSSMTQKRSSLSCSVEPFSDLGMKKESVDSRSSTLRITS